MKKVLGLGLGLLFGTVPLFAAAQITTLNGLTDAIQQLVSPGSNATNTMHMEIIQVGTDRHRFRWDGTPWRVDQGGTGAASFNQGNLLFGNGTDPIAADSALVWDSVSKILTMGISTEFESFVTGIHAPSATLENAPGGSFEIKAGNATGNSVGGSIDLFAGDNRSLGGGGNISLWGATGRGGHGGSIFLEGGSATEGDADGGTIILASGFGSGSGSNADVEIFSARDILLYSDSSATTTVSFGVINVSSSKVCFNTKNTDGDDISFYFVGTTMVVENNSCQ